MYTQHYQHIVRDYCDSAEEDDMTEDQDQEVEGEMEVRGDRYCIVYNTVGWVRGGRYVCSKKRTYSRLKVYL